MAEDETATASSSLRQGLSPYFLYTLLVATLGPLLFGYHLAELNAPQAVLTCTKQEAGSTAINVRLPQCIPMTPLEFGLVTSMFTLGGLVGALSISTFANKHGRVGAMRAVTLFFVLGPVFEACATSVAVMTVGRFISGLGAGAALVVVPIYLSEITPASKRGFFGSFTQVATNMGIVIANLLGLFLSRGQLWRIILGVGGGIGLGQLGGLLLVAESPKWLAEQGQDGLAKRALAKLRSRQHDVQGEMAEWNTSAVGDSSDEAARLLDEDTGSPKPSKHHNVTIITALASPKYRRATLVVMMVMTAQQFTGINSIVMYGVKILSSVLSTSAAMLNVFIALINLFATLSLAPLSDRLGRKACLLYSTAGMGSASILLGIGILTHTQILSAVASLMFVGAFALGLGPVPFIMASELVGTEAVGATQSWALAANWIATFVVAQFLPALNDALGPGKVYFVFAAFAVVFWVLIGVFVPETKGKRDLDEVWGRTPARVD